MFKQLSLQNSNISPKKAKHIAYWMVRGFTRVALVPFSRVHTFGVDNIPASGGCILAINHLIDLDVPVVSVAASRQVVYMGTEKLFHGEMGWPVWLLRLLGGFPVSEGSAAIQGLFIARSMLQQGYVVGIFPEGRRNRTQSLLEAQDGVSMLAMQTKVPVIPVAVWGTNRIFHDWRPHVSVSFGRPLYPQDLFPDVVTSQSAASEEQESLSGPPGFVSYSRDDIQAATTIIMRAIAVMLPESFRGIYG